MLTELVEPELVEPELVEPEPVEPEPVEPEPEEPEPVEPELAEPEPVEPEPVEPELLPDEDPVLDPLDAVAAFVLPVDPVDVDFVSEVRLAVAAFAVVVAV